MKVPDVSYARSGDVSIAYQVVGEGPTDLVLLPFLSNLYTLWLFPKFARLLRRLAEGRRLVVINLRGVGLSDSTRGFTIESRMDDLRAVLDAEGIERPALPGLAEAAATCAVFAASNPDRVERLSSTIPGRAASGTSGSATRRWRRSAKIASNGADARFSRSWRARSTRSGPTTRITSSGLSGTTG